MPTASQPTMDEDEIIVTSPASLNRSSPDAASELISPASVSNPTRKRHRRTQLELLKSNDARATRPSVGTTASTNDLRYANRVQLLGADMSEGSNSTTAETDPIQAQQDPPPSDNSAQQNEIIPPTSLPQTKTRKRRVTEVDLLDIGVAQATLSNVGRTAFMTDRSYANQARLLGFDISEGSNSTVADAGTRQAQQDPPPSDNSALQNDHVNNDPEQLSKPTRAVKLRHEYVPPAANNEELVDDLEDFGFDQSQVKNLMSKREFRFDATMQRPHLQTREDRENERRRLLNGSSQRRINGWKPVDRPTRDGQQPVKKRKVSGDGLVVEGSGNWILFDPYSHNLRLANGKEIPPNELPTIYQKYIRYEPGNARIVEINTSSDCVRLKSTPESLKNKTIIYTNEGPKISRQLPIQQPTQQQTQQSKFQAPLQPPKRGPSRPRKQGVNGVRGGAVNGGRGSAVNLSSTGRMNGSMPIRKEIVNGSVKTGSGAATRPVQKSPMTAQVKDEDSGSESPLTDIEESIEVGDSQEGDSSLTDLTGGF